MNTPKLVIQLPDNSSHALLVDKNTGKTVIQFNYDDPPEQAIENVITALNYVNVKVEKE